MKLLFENWRQYLHENTQLQPKLGIYIKDPTWAHAAVQIAMIDLSKLKSKLAQSQNLDDFIQRIEDKDFYKNSLVGYIEAESNKFSAQAHSSMGGSGGECYKAWSVKQSIGKGYGKQLYDALLGWAAIHDIYITPDRVSISGLETEKGAASRWKSIDSQTNDEVPPKDDIYLGIFDDPQNTQTPPTDDDCNIYGKDYLDKGYKDSKKTEYYNMLKSNLEEFFSTDIEILFGRPSFFDKILGNAPQDKTQKIKDKLLKIGEERFLDFWRRYGTRATTPP